VEEVSSVKKANASFKLGLQRGGVSHKPQTSTKKGGRMPSRRQTLGS
jgi:hypothetical protein